VNDNPISLRAGEKLGRYELLAPIARGGMGQVWVARLRGARGFQKLVAIKTLLPVQVDDLRMERMLLEEARIASLIQHSNVVQTLELGEHEGTLYLVMEWVDGEPLSYLRTCAEQRGGIPLPAAVNLVAQTLRGLQAAHELRDDSGASLGVVHRDVSPHNVLVSFSGVAKLLDFGIAKAMNQGSSGTETGEIKGKFAYMAPEQILGEEVDQRADIFATGIMLYLLTVGHHPFKNHDSAGVLHSITSEEPAIRPSLIRTSYSRTLEAVVMKALDKDREQRWGSALEMRLALQAAMPQAFGLSSDSLLTRFMTDLLGERAAHKRAALRRAELDVDAQLQGSQSLLAINGSPQSASSLRAISIDGPRDSSPVALRNSRAPTLAPPTPAAPRRRPARGPWLVGAAAVCIALVALVAARRPTAARHDAASPSLALSELTPAKRARAEARAPEPIPAAPALPSANAAPAPSAHVAAPTPSHHPGTSRKSRMPRPSAPTAAAKGDDLIAPDYAR
jgi:serine/threonine protein kinase